MTPIYGVPTCECRTNMRPRWSRDGGRECSFARGAGGRCQRMHLH